MLHRFAICGRRATPSERLEPFERYRRGFAKAVARLRPFDRRAYIEQAGLEFDPRLLSVRVGGTVYLDGLWQSERYFADVEATIRSDLRITPPEDAENRRMADRIDGDCAVALHVRWFDAPGQASVYNAASGYYRRAIELIEQRASAAHYFVFSDDPAAALRRLDLPPGRSTVVTHNRGAGNAYADLWLMTRCRHFIIANSTFSWWAAWLAEAAGKVIVAPDMRVEGKTAWGFAGLLPDTWIAV